MNEIYIAYAYTARDEHNNKYQGFHSMVEDATIYTPRNADMIQSLQRVCNAHCCRDLGMEAATTTIIFWKKMGDR